MYHNKRAKCLTTNIIAAEGMTIGQYYCKAVRRHDARNSDAIALKQNIYIYDTRIISQINENCSMAEQKNYINFGDSRKKMKSESR